MRRCAPIPAASRRAKVRQGRVALLAVFVLFPVTAPLAGQARINDLVISAGVAAELWRGDFSALTVPQIDSTESATAGVGEWSLNGIFTLLAGRNHSLGATIDGGIRQFAAHGFQLRNYSPREHSGLVTTTYTYNLGGGRFGTFKSEAAARIRRVVDRPPMPLYLSPAHDIYTLSAEYRKSVAGMNLSVDVAGEHADYAPPLPKRDFLDRSSLIVEAGGTRLLHRFEDSDEYSGVRFFGAYRYHSYPGQGGEVPRADHAVGLGGAFEIRIRQMFLEVALDGTRSRSTSRRVEYYAGRLELTAQWLLGQETQLGLAGTLARKRYIDPGQDALVPGEEADNASILHVELSRALGPTVSGAFRIGWQKIETHFSGAYYTRFGGTFFLRFRPRG